MSVAMALCMIAVVFTALPTKAEVYYTGTVQTMDDSGTLKTVFFEGDEIYVNVTMYYQNVLVNADINVQLLYDGGGVADSFSEQTDDPAVGYYNSTIALVERTLTCPGVSGDMEIFDVLLRVDTPYGWVDVAREQVVVRNAGISLEPATYPYYPGQDVTVTVTTGNTAPFYVQVLDDYDHDLVMEQTDQEVDETGVWTWTFTIPEDADAGDYRVRVFEEVTDIHWFTAYFYIATFYFDVSTDRSVVMPGETVTVEYITFDIATLDVYMDVDTEWNAIWYNLTGVEQIDVGELVPSYEGYKLFTIPSDINLSSDYVLHFWVNDTDGRSTEAELSFGIGVLAGSVSVYDNTYLAGENVNVEVDAWVYFDWAWYESNGLPGAEVDIEVDRNGEVIAEYGASGLMTGEDGVAVHEFELADDAEVGTYTVTATISKIGYSLVRMTTFEVEQYLGFWVELDKEEYYSGETATAKFMATWGAEEFTNISVFYIVHSAVGNLTTGNSSNGEDSTFTVPSGFVGWMWIEAMTTVNGNFLYNSDGAWVSKAFVAVTVSFDEYRAGQTVDWDFQIMTSMTSGLLSYTIEAAGGTMVASAALPFATSGTISYTVPAENPANWYELTVVLKDGLGNEDSDSETAYLVQDYTLSVWLAGDSGFVGGAFEPGDEVEIQYEVVTNGVAHKSVYEIWFYAGWADDDVYHSVLTTSATGTLSVTVPNGVADGTYYIDVWLYDGLTDDYLGYDWAQVEIEADQSGWTKEIAGMSAVDFITLVLIVVMIVLLIVVPFLKGRSGPIIKKKEHAPAPEPTPMEPPPAPPQ
ncbi:MAG: hypothetical protein AB7S97_01330 [Thermoplasmata archaeon]